MREDLKRKLFALINIEKVLDYYDSRIKEKVEIVLNDLIEDLVYQKAGNKLPEDWKDMLNEYYVDTAIDGYNRDLLDWVNETQANGIYYYTEQAGSFEVKDDADFFQLIMSAQFICIENVAKDAIEKAIEKGILKE